MGQGYTPFSSGFGGFSFDNPMDDEAERRRREQLEQDEMTSLRQSMETKPSWDDAEGKSIPGSITDEVSEVATQLEDPVGRGLDIAGEGSDEYMRQYAEHLGNRPQQGDYDPSTLRKILSVIGGTLAGGDPNVTRSLAGYGGYDRDLQDWEARGEGLGEVAELESLGARSRNTLGGSAMAAGASELGSRRREGTATADRPHKVTTAEAAESQAATAASRAPGQIAAEAKRAESGRVAAESGASRARTYAADVGAGPEGPQKGSRLWDRQQPPVESGAGLSPADIFKAKQLAIRNILEDHPEWADFYNEETGEVAGDTGWFGAGELPAEFQLAIEEEMEKLYPGSIRQTRGGLGDVPPPGGGQ